MMDLTMDTPKKKSFTISASYITYVEATVEAEDLEEVETLMESKDFFNTLDWEEMGQDSIDFDDIREDKDG